MNIKNLTWKISGKTKTFPICNVLTATIDDNINAPFDLDVAHILPSTRKKENTALIVNALDMFKAIQQISNESVFDADSSVEDLKSSMQFIKDIASSMLERVETTLG